VATNVAKWDGTNWAALGHGIRDYDGGGGVNGRVRALALHGNRLFCGGSFKRAGTLDAANIAVWDGTNWSNFGSGASGTVTSLVPNGSELYAVGSCKWIADVYVSGTARWDGNEWLALGGGIIFGAPVVGASSGMDIYVGGDFRFAGNKPSTNIALWHIPHSL